MGVPIENCCKIAKNGLPCERERGHSGRCSNKWCRVCAQNLKLPSLPQCKECRRKSNRKTSKKEKKVYIKPNWRAIAIDRLGGIRCAGLSFIEGPSCPVTPECLTLEDIHVGHRISFTDERNTKGGYGEPFYKKVSEMSNAEEFYINLCALCNWRMKYIRKEWSWKKLPDEVIELYEKELWTLTKLGKEYECDKSTVSKFLKNRGIKIRSGPTECHRLAKKNSLFRKNLLKERQERWATKERIKLAKEISYLYYELGDTFQEIQEVLGVSPASARTHLKMLGLY